MKEEETGKKTRFDNGFLSPFEYANTRFENFINSSNKTVNLLEHIVQSRQLNHLKKTAHTEEDIKTKAHIEEKFRRFKIDLRLIRWLNLLFRIDLNWLIPKDYRSSIKTGKKELSDELNRYRVQYEEIFSNIEKKLSKLARCRGFLKSHLSWGQLGVMAEISERGEAKGEFNSAESELNKLYRSAKTLETIAGDQSIPFESFIFTHLFFIKKDETSDQDFLPQFREKIRKRIRMCRRYMVLYYNSLNLLEEKESGKLLFSTHFAKPYKVFLEELYVLNSKTDKKIIEFENLLNQFKVPFSALSLNLLSLIDSELSNGRKSILGSKRINLESGIQQILTVMNWEIISPNVGQPFDDREHEVETTDCKQGTDRRVITKVKKEGYKKKKKGKVIRKAKVVIEQF